MKKFYNWCKRYISVLTIVVLLLVVYVLLGQENSMFRLMEYSRTIDSLNVEIANARDSLEKYDRLNSQLQTNPELMERVVREQYNMVREGEDVYVFK